MSKQPWQPHQLTRKRAQFLHSPRTSTSSSEYAKNSIISHFNNNNYPPPSSSWRTSNGGAVVTMANNDNTCYSKKCRHFLMVVNLVKVQIATIHHIIEARKIFGNSTTRIFTRNHSDRTHLHTQIAPEKILLEQHQDNNSLRPTPQQWRQYHQV